MLSGTNHLVPKPEKSVFIAVKNEFATEKV